MKKYAILMIITLLMYATTNAQVIMSSIGMMGAASSTMSSLNFKSNTACIDVQSGLAVLNGIRGNGEFAFNCEVAMKFNSLGIKLFPNPVNNNTRVKFVNTPPLTETFNLNINDLDYQPAGSNKKDFS